MRGKNDREREMQKRKRHRNMNSPIVSNQEQYLTYKHKIVVKKNKEIERTIRYSCMRRGRLTWCNYNVVSREISIGLDWFLPIKDQAVRIDINLELIYRAGCCNDNKDTEMKF